MQPAIWKKLNLLNDYLESKRKAGIRAFDQLIQRAESDGAKYVVVFFSYERPEALGKVGDTLLPYDFPKDTLNNYEIDDKINYQYEASYAFGDYVSEQLQTIAAELVKLWMAACFETAHRQKATNIPFYYKANHDDMEILSLADHRSLYEQSEFANFVRNNEGNQLPLLGTT